MIRVELPDGNIGEFPDDMPHSDIEGIIQKQFPPLSKKEQTPDNENLLQKSGRLAEKYISNPIEASGLPGAAGGLLQGTANIGPGLYNLGAKATNMLPGMNVEEKKGYHFAPEGLASTIGEIGSFFLPGAAAGKAASHIESIPSIANMMKKASDIIGTAPSVLQKGLKAGKELGKNALLGAVMSPEEQGIGAALGAGGSALGYGLGKSIGKVGEKLGIGSKPGRETIEGLSYSDVSTSVNSAERLGTPLKPSEASKNPFVAGIEGRYPRTREAAKENVELGMKRTESEKSAINKLLNTVYDKSEISNNKIKDLYQKAYRWNMKPNAINELKSDPVISEAFENVSKDKAWQRKLSGVPENNYAYLDKVRKSLADTENKLIKSGEKSKALEYTEARNSLVDMMDKAVPDYAKARSEAQKGIIRSQIEKKLGTSEINGKNFFNKIIRNENKFNDLHKSLKNVPEAQSMIKDMKNAWHSLINVEKPSTSSYQSEKAINQARSSFGIMLEFWKELTGKKKNVEAIKFIRGNSWVKELQNSSKSGDKNRLENTLSGIMGKIFPGGFGAIKEGNEE